MFIETLDREFKFNSCEGCKNSCCGGKFLLAPLILDDFIEVYKFFPILFGAIRGEVRAFIPLFDGEANCIYLGDDKKCTIYENRPPSCRIYPFSPYYEKILIDSSCEAINSDCGSIIYSNNEISESFYHKRLNDFLPKYRASLEFFDSIKDSLEFTIEIVGNKLFKFNAQSENPYIQMHLESLQLFNKNFSKLLQ